MTGVGRKSKKELRKFGLTVGTVFGIFAAILLWRDRPAANYFAAVSGILIISGLLVPGILRAVEYWWMRLAAVLGFISTRIILTIAFYLIIMPFGIVLRLLGRDLLSLRLDRDSESYWLPVEQDGPQTRPTKPY